MKHRIELLCLWITLALAFAGPVAAEDWVQFKNDCRHSGNVPDRSVQTPLGLAAAVPLTDAVFTSPVVQDGRVYVVDGSGVVFCLDAMDLEVLWKFAGEGGAANCNNVSSPAISGRYLHFGTMAGVYYVLDSVSGAVVKEIPCGEPVFSTPVVSNGRVYFATLGCQVYAITPDGGICWKWDFVKEVLGFQGNRWSGQEWASHLQGRVTWKDQFSCSQDIAAWQNLIVVPVGGSAFCLEDLGGQAKMHARAAIPAYAGSEYPGLFGTSISEDGAIYQQFHRRDNSGRVDIIRLRDGKVEADYVRDTETAIHLPRLLSFSSVSIRGQDVYRTSPEQGFAFCRHTPGEPARHLGGFPTFASPILLKDQAVFGALDGRLYVVPLSGQGQTWSFATAFGKAITASVAVSDGRIYFGCDDGWFYALAPGGKAELPNREIPLWRIRTPLRSEKSDAAYDWFTNYGNLANTNANSQGVEPPLKIKWIRRYEGTFKHVPVCGGGRMYTHTAEGQIFAVEQETGRLLWRRYWPDVHLSFTSPIYYRNGEKERLLVPQAGMKHSLMRCLDAETGELIWEAPFTGSPSWSRQGPPVIHKNLAIYSFGSGTYAAQGTEKAYIFKGDPQPSADGTEVMSWIYTHDNPYYPKDNKPLVRAWDLETGRIVWDRDFSEAGSGGNDSGLCLMDDTLYYSTFFGYASKMKDGSPRARGLTAAMKPQTGEVIWSTTEHSVTAGCTISGKDGRLYVGGYNQPHEETQNRYVWCLDAVDGSLVWQSEPVKKSVNVVAIGDEFVFVHGSTGSPSYLIDKETGRIRSAFDMKYACTRFTVSLPYIVGCNMDLIDPRQGNKVVSSGPCVDARECIAAIVSNGRIFYTSQSNGLQVSQAYGQEASAGKFPWRGAE
jgi:outer membrane protein assembly factor BamB